MTVDSLSKGNPQVNYYVPPTTTPTETARIIPHHRTQVTAMEEKPSATQGHPLTNIQQTRAEFARRDLDYARSEDLAQLPAAGLIFIIERLRGRLDDVLNLLDELTNE